MTATLTAARERPILPEMPPGTAAVYAHRHHGYPPALYRVMVTDGPAANEMWAEVRPAGVKPRGWPGGNRAEYAVLRERLFSDEAAARAWLVMTCKADVRRAERALAKVKTLAAV